MENRYITQGIASDIPLWLQNLLWFLRDSMQVEQKDYLQVFDLTRTDTGQHIVHRQEQPPYERTLDVPCDDAVTARIFIINDKDYVTMLLANEY